MADGRAYCWGWNYSGTLGNNDDNSKLPVAVDTSGVLAGKTSPRSAPGGVTHVRSPTAGHTAGDTTTTANWEQQHHQSLVPVAVDTSGVLAGKTVTAISAGYVHTCAVADGKGYCWGANGHGQLGDNSTTTYSACQWRWIPPGCWTTRRCRDQRGRQSHVCGGGRPGVLLGQQRLRQAGEPQDRQLAAPVAVDISGVLAQQEVTAISAGFHTCVMADGLAYCWGNNDRGELGNNRTGKSKVPVAVDTSGVLDGKTVTAISARGYHTCAIADGRAYCWGCNGSGELGNKQLHGVVSAGGGGHHRGTPRPDRDSDQRQVAATRRCCTDQRRGGRPPANRDADRCGFRCGTSYSGHADLARIGAVHGRIRRNILSHSAPLSPS